jgi:predicted small metal-binding protein
LRPVDEFQYADRSSTDPDGKECHMRVVECDICGETISAESDAELKARLGEHLGAAHDRGTSPEELDQLVAVEAYEATDS